MSVIQCASCPQQIDVSGIDPGSIVQCPGCNTQIQIPGEPKPKRSPTRRSGPGGGPRSTRLRKSGGGGGGIIIAILVVVVIGGIVGAIVFLGGDEKPKRPIARKKNYTRKKPSEAEKQEEKKIEESMKKPEEEKIVKIPSAAEVQKQEEEEQKQKEEEEAAKKEEEEKAAEEDPNAPKKITIMIDGNKVDTYDKWVPGAREEIPEDKFPPAGLVEEDVKEARQLLEDDNVDELLKHAYKFYTPVIYLLTEDDETIAFNAFKWVNAWCVLFKAKTSEEGGVMKFDERIFPHPYNRGEIYLILREYKDLFKDQFAMQARWGDPWADPKKYDPAQMNWSRIIKNLKHYQHSKNPKRDGPYSYDPEHQGGKSLERLKKMGKFIELAYPYLVHFVSSPDPGHRKAAVVALNKLTGLGLWTFPKTQEDGRRIQKNWMEQLDIQELPQGLPE